MKQANLKTAKQCAFCRYWNDPADSAIHPKSPQLGIWEYDEHARAMCMLKNRDTPGSGLCSRYECKKEIYR